MVPPTVRIELRIPTATVFKVLFSAFLVWAILKLWPEVVFLSLSVLVAIALEPTVAALARRGVPRAVAAGVLGLAMIGAIAGFVVFVLPPLARQTMQIVSDLPTFHERINQHTSDSPALRKVVDQIFLLPSSPDVSSGVGGPLAWGRAAISGAMTTFFVLVATLYLVLDGRQVFAWLLAYVPRAHREKVRATAPEISRVVTAYVRAQALTSALFALFVAIALTVLRVPAVLPLAVLAAVCDVIPVAGIIVATVPAVLLALTRAPTTALLVLGLYAGYHLIESYVLVPRLYGNSLRLSTLAVLLALIVGGTLQGILGAILILPVVAAYPIIERIWLKDYLSPDVLSDHDALSEAAERGSDGAIDAVIRGELRRDAPPPPDDGG